MNIVALDRVPLRRLNVVFALAPEADPGRIALSTAWFVTRLRAADKRLRLTVARDRCSATPTELVLVFAPLRGSSLATQWLEEVKPAVREIAAGFEGAELRSVEVVSE